MEYPDAIFEKKDNISTLTLNRPEKFNAFSPKLRSSIARAIEYVANDQEIRVLIITGAGKGFCSGFDLSEGRIDLSLQNPAEIGLGEQYRYMPMGWISLLLRRLSKPIIAAVNGIAAGGGFGLALACDIRIASEKARFSSAFALRGLVPDSGVSYLLPQIVGRAKALELMWTGDIINAQEALAIGLVTQVVPHEELMNASINLAQRFVQAAPIAVQLIKKEVDRSCVLEAALEYESYLQNYCLQTEDVQEGISSFLEKRSPIFKGK